MLIKHSSAAVGGISRATLRRRQLFYCITENIICLTFTDDIELTFDEDFDSIGIGVGIGRTITTLTTH